MKRSGIKRKPKAPLTKEQKTRRAAWFSEVTKGKSCIVCGRGRGRIEGHHVVPKGVLKQYGLPASSLVQEDQEELIWGVNAWANGVPVCSTHHELHTRAIQRIPRSKLPATALIWAQERGLLGRLENEYPEE